MVYSVQVMIPFTAEKELMTQARDDVCLYKQLNKLSQTVTLLDIIFQSYTDV